jgi:hypothetical protein
MRSIRQKCRFVAAWLKVPVAEVRLCVSASTLSTHWFGVRLTFGNVGYNDTFAVGKLGDKRQMSTHRLDVVPQRGNQ